MRFAYSFADGWKWLRAAHDVLLAYPAGILVLALGVLCARSLLGPFSFATDALALTAAATLFPEVSGVTADELRERTRLQLVAEASAWGIVAGICGWLFLALVAPAVSSLGDDHGSETAILLGVLWLPLSYVFYYFCAMFTVYAVLSAARDGTAFAASGRAAVRGIRRTWKPLLAIYLSFAALAYPGVYVLARLSGSLPVRALGEGVMSAIAGGAYAWPALFLATALFLALGPLLASLLDENPLPFQAPGQCISRTAFVLGCLMIAGAAGGGLVYGNLSGTMLSNSQILFTGIIVGAIGLGAYVGALDFFAGRAGGRRWVALAILLGGLALGLAGLDAADTIAADNGDKELEASGRLR